ncbi:unnamed protein product [Caretta caretta]
MTMCTKKHPRSWQCRGSTDGPLQTGGQCIEIKRTKTDHWKARDENALGNSPSSCLFHEEFDWVLGTALSTEPTAVHDSLISQDGNLLTLKSKRSQQPLYEAYDVTLLLMTVLEEAMLPEQLQHILAP